MLLSYVVLYVSVVSKVRPRTFGCVAMGSAVLFILRSRSLLYSAGSGVNRVQVVLSGFSVGLLCFVKAKLFVGMVVCISWLLVCVDVMVMSSASFISLKRNALRRPSTLGTSTDSPYGSTMI